MITKEVNTDESSLSGREERAHNTSYRPPLPDSSWRCPSYSRGELPHGADEVLPLPAHGERAGGALLGPWWASGRLRHKPAWNMMGTGTLAFPAASLSPPRGLRLPPPQKTPCGTRRDGSSARPSPPHPGAAGRSRASGPRDGLQSAASPRVLGVLPTPSEDTPGTIRATMGKRGETDGEIRGDFPRVLRSSSGTICAAQQSRRPLTPRVSSTPPPR